ncbi:hypothetical protein BX281_0068 [Streptomyces sp. Ag82_O1-15]|uniref:hypothetical protein n=1 Tax=Streptomyces sp. Ag82_O1-15 TaxID=1938855 RepID=UPI000BB15A84|nr:hypothetical protein [Streptomyces sp. Ag82_O1-15]PBC92419.1 hypothetical protein BX281_0068 [Streptomyces sp. Ag82_O1-15]
MLRRGLALGCEQCPAFEFYPLEELAQRYRCRRCGAVNDLVQARWKTGASEPEWYYELHPAVAELIDRVVLATAAPAWDTSTTTVARREPHGLRTAGKYTPDLYLLTAVGSSPALELLASAQG